MSQAPAQRAANSAAAPKTSMRMSRCSELVTSPIGTATTTVSPAPPGTADAYTRQRPDPLTEPAVEKRGLAGVPARRCADSFGSAPEVASCT